jgi:hypothetical protein
MNKDPHIDPKIWEAQQSGGGLPGRLITGIYVRARRPDGGWESVDLAYLDGPSLLWWLRSQGGDNRLAEDVVGILLGHGHLH